MPVDPGPAEHVTSVRVRYPETDPMGIVHHSHYLVWFEVGRTELMRDLGCPYAALERDDGVLFPVIEARARYRAPARYDERVRIRTRLVGLSRSRVRFEYRVLGDRGEAGERVLAEGFTEHAAAGRDGRPRRLPADLVARLAGATSE